MTVSSGVLAVGCTLLADADREQCTTNQDCTVRGGAFADSVCVQGFCEAAEATAATCDDDDDCSSGEVCSNRLCEDVWACLGPEEEPDGEELITVSVTVAPLQGEVRAGIRALLCHNYDPSCTVPQADLTTDGMGQLHLEVEPGFTGFLDINEEGYFPLIYTLPTTLVPNSSLPGATLSPVGVIEQLALAVSDAPNPERGHIFLNASNCVGPAEGVRFSSMHADADTTPFYVNTGVPTSALSETTEAGSGGFLNFPPGNSAVTLWRADNNEEVATLGLVVRANYITTATFGPPNVVASAE